MNKIYRGRININNNKTGTQYIYIYIDLIQIENQLENGGNK